MTAKDISMPMSLRLRKIDSNEILFDYSPEEFQWWINGFDPSHQYANADNLELQITIDFSMYKDLYDAFKETWDGSAWKFNDMQATYTWRNK